MVFIKDIKEGDNIVGHYFCREKVTMKSQRTGKSYLSLKLSDKTGAADAKVWDLNHHIQNFETGDYIKIDATATIFNNALQLRVTRIRKSLEGEYLLEDYLPVGERDPGAVFAELKEIIATVKSPHIRTLLENIFINNESLSKKFREQTAAKTYHHCYVGGLMEHTLSVTRLCDFLSSRYKFVNRDILIAAAMLHDIGKTSELSGFPENNYTDEGQLIGHIVMGAELVTAEAAKIPDFPEKHKLLLKHCILAHHGEYEFGSPRVPNTIEAFMLYSCDNMDAKLQAYEETIENDNTQGDWAGYNKMLARNIRKPEKDA